MRVRVRVRIRVRASVRVRARVRVRVRARVRVRVRVEGLPPGDDRVGGVVWTPLAKQPAACHARAPHRVPWCARLVELDHLRFGLGVGLG